MTTAAATIRNLLRQRELPIGTTPKYRAIWLLFRAGILDRHQYRVGPDCLNFAWPELRGTPEVGGPHHWQPYATLAAPPEAN
jgi:hypothetical protein